MLGVYQKAIEKYEYHPFLGSNDIRINDNADLTREQLFVQCVVSIHVQACLIQCKSDWLVLCVANLL